MPQYQGVWTLPVAARLQSTQQWATDPLYKNTTLLLQADNAPNGAQNNTFLDSSSNNFTITRNGNTTQGTFTPYSLQPGAWSTYFPGASSLIVPAGSAFAYGTGAFTVEAWINPYTYQAGSSTGGQIISQTTSGQNYFVVQLGAAGELNFTFGSGGGTTISTAPGSIPLGIWTHVAVVREGTGASQLKLYVNGFLLQSGTCSFNFTDTTYNPTVGNYTHNSTQLPFGGYISNLRVVKGVAVYTGNFTPSSLPLAATQSAGINTAAITGTQTSLLTAQSNRFLDNSVANAGGGWTVTLGGTPSVQAFSPFAPQYQWTAPVIGGSTFFDGTGDYLQIANNTVLTPTGDFTIEFWAYVTDSSGTQEWYSKGYGIQVYIAGGVWGTAFSSSNNSTYYVNYATVPVITNAWTHVATTRSGNTYRLFINGVETNSATSSSAPNTGTDVLRLGEWSLGTTFGAKGYMAGVRYLNGTALYTSNFTPPTSPPTAITNTQLLTNFTNAGIYDGTMKNNLETVGNAQVNTSIVKYGTGSMAFDGSGDALSIRPSPDLQLGSGDWTVEMWVYLNSTSVTQDFFSLWNGGSAGSSYAFLYDSNLLYFYWYTTVQNNVTVSWTPFTATWYHLAFSKSGTTLRFFVNGTQQGSNQTVSTTPATGTVPVYVGGLYSPARSMNGYLDDLRITKGIARYIANFTPPTVALPRQ